MRALGRLLRLSLAPTAIADVAAGTVLAAGEWPAGGAPFVLIGASLALYHGGLVLNDWADRDFDARTRPARPLPSGAIPPPVALVLALALIAGGVLLASTLSRTLGGLTLCLALVVLVYDLGPRSALGGPLCLALARAMNLSLGIVLGATKPGAAGLAPLALLLAPLGYGAYVFLIARVGRLEDAPEAPPPGRTRGFLRAAAWILLLLPLAVGSAEMLSTSWDPRVARGTALALVLSTLAARGLLNTAELDPRTPGEIVPAMGVALRRLLIATTCLTLLANTPSALLTAALLLAGYPLSHALRRVFPPS